MCFVKLLCCRHGQGRQEIERYVEKMSALEEKCDMYMELEWWSRALELASRLKDISRIQQVKR